MADRRTQKVSERSIRLYFRYTSARPSSIQLLADRTERVDVIPLGSVAAPLDGTSRSGFWFEVKGPGDSTLYRRVCSNPIAVDYEVPEIVPGKRPLLRTRRWRVRKPAGTFTILIPDEPEATTLRFWGSPPGEEGLAKGATMWKQFPVAEWGH